MKTKALYSGSFDPPTMGHMDIISRAAKLYDELVIGVIGNPSKKSMFTLEEREDMLRETLKDFDNVSVDHFSGLLADVIILLVYSSNFFFVCFPLEFSRCHNSFFTSSFSSSIWLAALFMYCMR